MVRWIPVGVSTLWISGCGKPETESPRAPEPVTVHASVTKVELGRVRVNFEASGTVRASLHSALASKAVGTVTAVNVREGDTVLPGQLLVTIDDRELAASSTSSSAALQAARASVDRAQTSVEVETRTSQSRIAQAEAHVRQAVAIHAAAIAHRDQVQQGARKQELAQAHLAAQEAESNLLLASKELDRAKRLAADEAISRRELDIAQNRYDVAKSHRDSATQAEEMAIEGSRSQEIRGAQEDVVRAKAAIDLARAALSQAKADALLTQIRMKDLAVANAQREQATASLNAAQIGLSYTKVFAPYAGRVVHRLADPGSMSTIGSPLLDIEGGDYLLEASVPETMLAQVPKGKKLSVLLNSKSTTGKVLDIVPQGDATSHSYIVKLSVGNPSWLRSGMYGKALIPITTSAGILIPASATWEREGLHYAYVLDDKSIARLRIVTLGKPQGPSIEILSGLSQGERIVTDHIDTVADGKRVEADQR